MLQRKEVEEGWLDHCKLHITENTILKYGLFFSFFSSYLPEGNYAFVHTYSLQRDPRYFFPFSESFIPERWLSKDQREALEPKIFNSKTQFMHNTAAFIPFSVGPANCVGKNFAWMELRMVMTLMASRFDLAFEPGYNPLKWCDDIRDYFITVKGQLPSRLSVRM